MFHQYLNITLCLNVKFRFHDILLIKLTYITKISLHVLTYLLTNLLTEGGIRVCGIAVLCCGNFYLKVRYCGFQSPSGVR